VTTSLEQTGLAEQVIRGYRFRLEPAVAIEDVQRMAALWAASCGIRYFPP
jgi:hypothetical protein